MFQKKKRNNSKIYLPIIIIALISLCILTAAFLIYSSSFNSPQPQALSQKQTTELSALLHNQYPTHIISPLPYNTIPADLEMHCGAAIMIDCSNGNVLYEKNADEIIPPASMTKLVVMYVVFQEIATGRISMSDIVPLPPESWAVNAPPYSSLMFLGQGQTVTLEELLLGLAVASGNDAAIAVAHYVSGSVDAFCARMNEEMEKLGLVHTHFVEPSGYSELNLTTPREFAAFARVYIERYPEALTKFHSVRSISYPQAKNLASWTDPAKNQPIIQYNTNKALDIIPGCDGLKTGFIYESGYNLAYTVKRGGTRFIAVIMQGEGQGSAEGNKYRILNSQTLTDWGYSTFATRPADTIEPIAVPVFGGSEQSLFLIPAYNQSLTVPALLSGKSPQDAAAQVTVETRIRDSLNAPVAAGSVCGTRVYSLNGIVLQEIPLVADRTVEQGSLFKRLLDTAAQAQHR